MAVGLGACSYPGLPAAPPASDTGPPPSVSAVVFLQRARLADPGDIFEYTSYQPGARLVELRPASPDGVLTTLCCDRAGPQYAGLDISGYDLSFDAASIVFSARLASAQHYGLFVLHIADGSVTPIALDPTRDHVSPIFLPGDRVMFATTAVVEPGAPQHRDEDQREVATQLGRVDVGGTDLELGPRSLSHRTGPSLASDGRVIFSQWDHLGPQNAGHLMFVDQDLQALHEAFGKEGTGVANSTFAAREISPGRFVAIAGPRAGTIQAGSVVDVRLGDVELHGEIVSAPANQAEARASYRVLTPDVPLDGAPSRAGVGRYHDAFALDARQAPSLLVSWADGPVEAGVLAAAGATANFGIYVYDSEHAQRTLLYDDPERWDLFPRPLAPRAAPPVVGSPRDPRLGGQALIGAVHAYDSTLHTFAAGEIYGIRVMEGFSSEEGFPRRFGSTGFEGHANLGVAPLAADATWSATIPANIPVHLQAIDRFGMSLLSEPVWISGRAGEAMLCGGCHDDRTHPPTIPTGTRDTLVTRATPMFGATPRSQRMNAAPTTPPAIVGVGWDKLLQPIFDANCVTGCHDASNSAGVPGYTITNASTGATVTWRFNLTGAALPSSLVGAAGGAFTASYFSMAGPDMEVVERDQLMITGNFKRYLEPANARGSIAIAMLNPTQLFPSPSSTIHAFATQPHLIAKGRPDLSSFDHYALILAADMGVSFYARENNPHVAQPAARPASTGAPARARAP